MCLGDLGQNVKLFLNEFSSFKKKTAELMSAVFLYLRDT